MNIIINDREVAESIFDVMHVIPNGGYMLSKMALSISSTGLPRALDTTVMPSVVEV